MNTFNLHHYIPRSTHRNWSAWSSRGAFFVILFIVLALLSARTAIAGNTTAQEYGDPVYRAFDFIGVGAYGHAGIYYGMNSSDTHYVIQFIDDHIRSYYTLSSFKTATTYWGAYDSTNSSSRPDTFSERQTIIQYADELDTQDPGYTLFNCINPISGWGTIMQPSEVDDIRCDGVVEYCYEYGTDFPVWGKNGTHYDISKYPSEHNTLYNFEQIWPNPDTGLAPMVQCGRAGGSSTYLTSNASIDYPNRTVTATYYSDRTVVTMRASDQSGIHRIRYKWGSSGTEHSYRYAQHPTQDYQELKATTYSTSDLYYWVQDGAGNDDGYWHIYTITVNQPPNTPYNEYPSDGATGVSRTANLDWSCTDPDGDTLYYTVWLSKGNNTFSSGERIKIDATGSNADPGTMDYGAHYYWKVQADDHKGGVATVDHWDFYTESEPTRIIRLSGDLAFGSVTVGQTSQRTLTIYNDGNSTLTVSGISYPTGFSGNWSGTISAGGLRNVTVTFAPQAAQNYSGNLSVSSDKTSGTNTRACSGTGTPVGDSPVIDSISPSTGPTGIQVTITGNNFGASQGSGYVTFYDGVNVTEIAFWSDTQIICTVPDGAQTGCVTVTTNEGTSNCSVFNIRPKSAMPWLYLLLLGD